MNTYLIKAYVDGKKTEQLIRALSQLDAEKLFRAQYSSSKITSLFSKKQ